MSDSPYTSLAGRGESEIIEKRSRFLAQCGVVSDEESFQDILNAAKKAHHSARHVCFAFRLKTGLERYSDDGEPNKTGGFPALQLLQGGEIVDAYVYIVRYYGGVKLGTGGLGRAYREASRLAIEDAGLRTITPKKIYTLKIPYPTWERFQYFVTQHDDVELDASEFTDLVTVDVAVVSTQCEEFERLMLESFREIEGFE